MTMRRLRTVVCGSTFGQFYLAALAELPERFEIVGVLGRGSERTYDCARRYGVPVYTAVEQLPTDVDVACVVLRSGVMGGVGTELALTLLKRGIHVIQEQPVHHDDIAACLRTARQCGVRFQLGDLYVHLPAVRRFNAAAQAAQVRKPALFIDAACSTQVSFPLAHILGAALPTVRPWQLAEAATGQGPLQVLTGTVGGIPFTLRAHNEVDPADPDNHIHLLHRITLGFEGGSLSLTDTHGPVTWNPRLHIPDAVKTRFDFDSPDSAHLALPSTVPLGPPQPPSYRQLLERQWPQAIGRDLIALHDAVVGGAATGPAEQRWLTLSRLWQGLTAGLGYPAVQEGRRHQPLPVEHLQAAVAAVEPEEAATRVGEHDVFGCTEPAETLVRGVTSAQVNEFVDALDEAVLASMLHALQARETLADPGRDYDLDEIVTGTGTAERHRPLIERWLQVLVERGRLQRHGERWRGVSLVAAESLAQRWERAAEAWNGGLGAAAFLDYLRHNAEQLPRLMRDEQQAALLLFPEGRTELADAVYRDTITARYLNTAVAEAVRRIAGDGRRTLRAIEIGAGTGATTEAVVRTLAAEAAGGLAVEYRFTDVSNFFLANARPRFRAHGWLSFGLLDIDRDPVEQGYAAGSADVVIAAGVLNNARDTDASVRGALRLLAPGGYLLITEPTREHLEILISQAFMMTPPADARQRTRTTFLSVAQWQDVLRRAGAESWTVLPGADHVLAPLGQRLFVARRGADADL
ncbi:thiazolinyl imide reductase subfamily [Alkalilimnicola ehrlichii]|uniref:Thiazolinyl imide reductase subfamily n=1 Tax=Alkalilimnicola ehrlichii TaxID=351052 RepID=A0A3E0WRY5_9GAMM|nr:Gfo/Idh/MocA family oxidoreductase [Alkalilimnicola ehrlichii]RFA28579.1 thiazolinyl imide reductase subfamily [Alkalilimnicola ehrlichii]RFA35744.1 thiazolinyl imide reductase subfamily [Alkalilimnicola ehrlichii]